MDFRSASKIVFLNIFSLVFFLAFLEILFRTYERFTFQPKYMNDFESELVMTGKSCEPPPIVTNSGDLSRYADDFSCGGVTVVDGRRLTTDQPENPLKTIHVFGGSTVFGTGSIDSQTIPSQLQKALNKKNINYKVKNYGFMTLVASQQFAALQKADVREGDIILFYDGGNDAFNSFVYDSPEGTIIGYNRQNRLAFALVKFRHLLQTNSAMYRKLGEVKASLSGKNSPSRVGCEVDSSLADQNGYIEHYFDVLRKSKDYSSLLGATFFHVLQPMLGSSNGLNSGLKDQYMELLDVDSISWCTQKNLLDYYGRLGKAYANNKNRLNGLDLSQFFEDSPYAFSDRYKDWIHMTPLANELIAPYIINHLGF